MVIPTYTYERKFGSQGSGDGEFLNPHDISFDAAGNVFVCDRDRNDVQKFTNAGVFISKFGSSGSGNGQFNVPYAIQHDPTHAFIYVADRENNRVQKVDAVTGAYISKITTVNGKSLNKPEDVTFDKTTGDIYILDTGNDRCVKLDKNHNFILQWGTTGSGNGQFQHPHSINTDSVGNVFISCGNQPYIQKFTPTGVFIKKFGTNGTGPGQTQMFLEHMDIDIFGYVHLINNDSRPIINVWDTDGNWLTQYGSTSSGSSNGQFKEPEHVTCDPANGKPFVVDCKNFRIQVFSVSVASPPPPPVIPPATGGAGLGPDLFGIRRFFPTKTGGREWFSNWHLPTTTDHTITSLGTATETRDPQDSLVDLHCPTGNVATVTQSTGIMHAGLEGAPDNDWRLYINDPLKVWKWDPSVEMTAYYFVTGTLTGGTIHVHMRLAGPTEHQLEFTCNASGHGYSFEIKANGVVQIRKEMMHDAYVDNLISTIVGGQMGVWIGMKLILLVQPDGNVLIRCYRDMAGGVGGGVWELMIEHLDTGDMVMTDPVEVDKFNGRNTTGVPECAGVDAINEILNFPASSCYFRMDNCPIDIKWASIREIMQTTPDSPGSISGVLTNSDIMIRLSGGSSNIEPNESKGGIMSTTGVNLNDILHNLFSDFPPDQLGPGTTKYRLVYIHNNSNTSIMKNVMVFVLVDSESLDTALFYGKAVAPTGEYETVIVNETDAPPGVTFNFGDTISTGINLGDLQPQAFKGLWLKLVCEPGADNYPEDKAFIRIVADPGSASNVPGGGTGGGTGGGGGTTPPPVDEPPVQTTPSYSFCVVGDLSTSTAAKANIAKMKGRNPELIFINGDCIYADNANSLKSELGTAWVAKTKISFGNHDVDESESQPSAKNSLKSTFNMPADYYTFTLNNMFCVVMDSEISNSTSSAQYTNLKPKLEAAAANSAIEWIFIFNHRPIYGDANGHHPNNENNEIQNWHAVWDANKVTAVWQSHNHDLFRTRPIKKGSGTTPIVTSTEATEYVNPTGEFFIGSGGGGKSHYSFGSAPAYTVFDDDSHYGYWLIDIYTNPRKAVFRCFSNSDALLHTFTVIHGGSSKYNIVTMTALGFDGSLVPPNADDDSMDTMWQHTANPTWLQADLGSTKVCSFVDIAWNGSSAILPRYTFNIEYSIDGSTWIPVINDRQNTNNLTLERYTFPGSVNARYIRVNIKGNTVDTKAAVLELDVGRLT
jgi:hypothetical protein